MINTYDSAWDALERDPIKRKNLKLRSELIIAISSKIEDDDLTVSELKIILNITEQHATALYIQEIGQFKMDVLTDFAIKLGLNASIKTS